MKYLVNKYLEIFICKTIACETCSPDPIENTRNVLFVMGSYYWKIFTLYFKNGVFLTEILSWMQMSDGTAILW